MPPRWPRTSPCSSPAGGVEADKAAARPRNGRNASASPHDAILHPLHDRSRPGIRSRKNPQAAVRAFRDAFAPGLRDVELVVKTRGDRDDGLRQWLATEAEADGRIRIVDRTLDRAGMDALMAGCDAFISLHRSEGFGFGGGEALAAGKAVVATDSSSTTDLIGPATGYPVAYRLYPV